MLTKISPETVAAAKPLGLERSGDVLKLNAISVVGSGVEGGSGVGVGLDEPSTEIVWFVRTQPTVSNA